MPDYDRTPYHYHGPDDDAGDHYHVPDRHSPAQHDIDDDRYTYYAGNYGYREHDRDHGPARDHDHLRDGGPAYRVRGAYDHDHYTDVRGAGSAGSVSTAGRLRYFYDLGDDDAEGPDIGGEG